MKTEDVTMNIECWKRTSLELNGAGDDQVFTGAVQVKTEVTMNIENLVGVERGGRSSSVHWSSPSENRRSDER